MTPATPAHTDAPSRPRARRGEGDRTREEILVAAEELLAASASEDAVSIRAVADAVGLTPPTIYRHFPDKAHLIFEVCARQFDVLDAEIVQPILADSDDPVEALTRLARAYIRFGVDNPEHYRIMFMGHADHTPEQYELENVLGSGALGSTIDLVQRAIDEGRLRPGVTDALAVTYALWAALHGVVSVAVAKPNMPAPPLEVQIDTVLDAVLHGLLR